MILKEFEGKELLKNVGLNLPKSIVVEKNLSLDLSLLKTFQFPVFIKAQVLHGNRELSGLIQKVDDLSKLTEAINQLFEKKDQYDQEISQILIEEAVTFTQSLYLAITYSTKTRTPVVQFSFEGGTGMDERGENLTLLPISISQEIKEFPPLPEIVPVIKKLFQVFYENDASLVEINPLVQTQNGFICLDAKIELEDTAKFRHQEWTKYAERSAIAKPLTEIEKKAREISRMDTRGWREKVFLNFLVVI
jgi:succinyl-CoA synthetase beta subunit